MGNLLMAVAESDERRRRMDRLNDGLQTYWEKVRWIYEYQMTLWWRWFSISTSSWLHSCGFNTREANKRTPSLCLSISVYSLCLDNSSLDFQSLRLTDNIVVNVIIIIAFFKPTTVYHLHNSSRPSNNKELPAQKYWPVLRGLTFLLLAEVYREN